LGPDASWRFAGGPDGRLVRRSRVDCCFGRVTDSLYSMGNF